MSTAADPGQQPESDPDRKSVEDARMTFLEHLYDLRKRLRNASLIFIAVNPMMFAGRAAE